MTEDVFVRRAWIAAGLLVLAMAVFLIAFQAMPVLLLLFLAVLLAVFIRALTQLMVKLTGWRFRWRMLTVVGGTLALALIGGFLLGPNAAKQIGGVMQNLPDVRQRLSQYGWAGLLYHIPGMEDLLAGHLNVWQRLTQSFSFSATFGPVISVGLVIVIGLYLAATPGVYVEGAVALAPPRARVPFRKLLDEMGETLRWWLVGQASGMVMIAIVVSVGLELVGFPLAVTLGIFAGMMAFIPNIGYFLSIAPAILLALLRSPLSVLYVLVLYTGAHWGNDFVLIPLVQRRTVRLPPAVTIGAQLVLGFLLGGIGLLIATPLMAVVLVAVKVLYLNRSAEIS